MKAKHIILTLACGLTFSSCSDFLTEEPLGKETPEKAFTSQATVDATLVGLYSSAVATQAWTNMQICEWQGDDITTNPGSNKQACAESDRFAMSNTNKGVVSAWKQFYGLIKRANFIINNVDKAPITDEEKNITLGQAKYWRAYAYFTLVRYFGALPLVTDETNDNYTMEMSPVSDIYDLIVSDLTAAENLPTKYDKYPRFGNGVNFFITQQAAKATLSAVYMAMAGYPLNKTNYYELAASKAKEVIDGVNSGKYEFKLDDDFKKVYAMDNNYNLETVVGLNYYPVIGSWRDDTSQLTSTTLFESLGGWGDSWGELKFWKEFPEGPRKNAVYVPQIRLKTGQLVNFWDKDQGAPVVSEQHPMLSTFMVNVDENGKNVDTPFDYTKAPSRNMTNNHRHRLIRYSEVLLWYAEAKARTGNADALAYDCLKKVRDRAGSTEAMPTTASELAEAAYREHGWEVAGYWVALVTRRADLFRMNRLKDVFAERAANNGVTVAPGIVLKEMEYENKTWNESLMYMPYPDSDASKNSNLKR